MRTIPADAETARPTMHFVPWGAMTQREQAEHLLYAHAMDADFLDLGREEDDPADALTYWLDASAEVRDGNHDDDHGQYPHGGGSYYLHTHDKTPSAWAAMTAREQAEHLVHVHQFDGIELGAESDAEAVALWEQQSADERTREHAADTMPCPFAQAVTVAEVAA
jgi:hypothetical protein